MLVVAALWAPFPAHVDAQAAPDPAYSPQPSLPPPTGASFVDAGAFPPTLLDAQVLFELVGDGGVAPSAADAAPSAQPDPVAYEPLPAPLVAAEPERSEPSPELSAVVISGKRIQRDGTLADRPSESVYGTNTPLVDTPRSVSQISNRQFQQDVVRSADDLIRYAPGVTFGGGQNVNIAPQIRGQNSEIFQDGQRIYNVRHPSNFNAYEGADVVAGAPSVMFGPVGSSGGYANYVTKKPRFGESLTQISGNVGSLAPRGQSFSENRLTIDSNQYLGKKFAYRGSFTLNRTDDFYDNVKNKFNAYYGAVAFQPLANLRIDWNVSYDDYYDYNITHGWNRVTQRLVDSYGKKYDAGRATPILENQGVGLWSPVFASGAPDSAIIGWQTRARDMSGRFVPTGPINAGPLPNAMATAPGTVRGWVYDPDLTGNDLRRIDASEGHRAEDRNTASRFMTQSNIHLKFGAHTSLNNKFLIARSRDTTNAVGSFLTQSTDDISTTGSSCVTTPSTTHSRGCASDTMRTRACRSAVRSF